MSASGRGVELQPPVTRRRASLFTRQNKYEVDYSELEAVGRKKSFANLRAAWLHGPHLLNATRYVDVSLPIEHDACSTMAYEVDDVCRSIYTPHAEAECCRGPCLHDDCSTALQEPRYGLPTAMFLMARRGEFTMVNIRVAQPAANTRVANGTACMESDSWTNSFEVGFALPIACGQKGRENGGARTTLCRLHLDCFTSSTIHSRRF